MEFFLVIGFIWLVSKVYKSWKNNEQDRSNSNSSQARYNYTNTKPQSTTTNQTFRPSATKRTSNNISFESSSSRSGYANSIEPIDLSGLHDAFTGAPLNQSLGLYQCQSCKVYYHTESLQVLREANNSQCVSCQSINIVAVTSGQRTERGRDYNPNIVTLNNFKDYVGRVVTFEGQVHRVNESRRGNDFAVMFENKSWARGFKLVFFRGAVRKVGGATYINSLSGKKVKVRGLIVNHPKFGYEIIVSEKSMILGVQQ